MQIEKLQEDITYITLPSEPDATSAIKNFNETASNNYNSNVIADLTYVQVLSSTGISNLLNLHNWLNSKGYKLILCNVCVITKSILSVAGLNKVFTFAENKEKALALLTRDSEQPANT